jgi:hypothetical protein
MPTPTDLTLMTGGSAESPNDGVSRYLPPRRSYTHGSLYGDYISAKPITVQNRVIEGVSTPRLEVVGNASDNDGLTSPVRESDTPPPSGSRPRRTTLPVSVIHEDDDTNDAISVV